MKIMVELISRDLPGDFHRGLVVLMAALVKSESLSIAACLHMWHKCNLSAKYLEAKCEVLYF